MQQQRKNISAVSTLPGSSTRGVAALALFAAVQLADGVLTFTGVARFGPAVESNPLLAFSMSTFGAGTTLSIMKALAVGLAVILHRTRSHFALACLTVLYVFAAVLPWAWLLLV
jgi:hypothetical protein